jgi:hypothetical protein
LDTIAGLAAGADLAADAVRAAEAGLAVALVVPEAR